MNYSSLKSWSFFKLINKKRQRKIRDYLNQSYLFIYKEEMSFCGCKNRYKPPRSARNVIRNTHIDSRFSEQDVQHLKKRYTEAHGLSSDGFKRMMGILGHSSLSVLGDMMFQSIDTNRNGFISLREYLAFMDILVNGSTEEKLHQSFQILDEQRQGKIYQNQFEKIVYALAGFWVSMIGGPLMINKKQVTDIFAFIAGEENGFFTRDQYFGALHERPSLLQLFDLNNQRMMMDCLFDVNVEKKRHFHASSKFASYVATALHKLVVFAETNPSFITEALVEHLFPQNLLPKTQDYLWNTYSPQKQQRNRDQSRPSYSDSHINDRTRTRTNFTSSQQLVFSRSKLSSRDGPYYDSTSRLKLESVFEQEHKSPISESSPGPNLVGRSGFVPTSNGDSIDISFVESDQEGVVPPSSRAPQNVLLDPIEDIQPIIDIPETSILPTGACDFFTFQEQGFSGLHLTPSRIITQPQPTEEDEIALHLRTVESLEEGRELKEQTILYQLRKLSDFVESFKGRIEAELGGIEREEDERKPKRAGVVNIPQNLQQSDNKLIKSVKAQRVPKNSVIPEQATTIHLAHQNFDLVAFIMFGIKRAVDSTFDTPQFFRSTLQLRPEDFKVKSQFDIFPSSSSSFNFTRVKKSIFKDYAPLAFQNIRQSFQIHKQDYISSLGPHQIMMSIIGNDYRSLRELCSSGKSGSFFYYTSDGRFMLKTVSRSQFHSFHALLPHYYRHVIGNPKTLISRIYGLHKILFVRRNKVRPKKVYFVIMNNVFNTERNIHERFDLKGSTVGRSVKEALHLDNPTIALKDLDFNQKVGEIELPVELRRTLLEQITLDSRFFEHNGIIDYSLLLGIHYLKKSEELGEEEGSPRIEQSDGGVRCGEVVLYFGIIDIFTKYRQGEHRFKQSEYHFKRIFYGSGISCVPPKRYAARFRQYLRKIFV